MKTITFLILYLIHLLPFDVTNVSCYDCFHINSFGDKETLKIWQGQKSKKFPVELQNVIRKKLRMIAVSECVKDLLIPPGNRLEKLSGIYEGYYSIRINNKWRIIFTWDKNGANYVRITDYH